MSSALSRFPRRSVTSLVASLALVAGMVSAVAVAASPGVASAQPNSPTVLSVGGTSTTGLTTSATVPLSLGSPTVAMSGTADPGSTVTIDDYGFAIATTTAGAEGSDDPGDWSLNVNVHTGLQELSAAETLNGETSALSSTIYVGVTADDLVTNGLFDELESNEPALSSDSYGEYIYTPGESPSDYAVPGWAPDDISQCDAIEIQDDEYGGGVDGSSQYTELASNCVGGVEQTINTVPGAQYQLQFSYEARSDTPSSESGCSAGFGAANSMSVEWGSTYLAGDGGPGQPDPGSDLVGDPSPAAGSSVSSGAWTTADYTVTATSDTTTIEFNDTNPCTGYTYGDFLDGVSVTPTIDLEPSNTSWLTANSLSLSGQSGSPQSGTTYQALEFPGEDLWYDFPVVPGEQVNVSLSGENGAPAPADYNLDLFSDISQTFVSDLTTTPSDLDLGAQASASDYSGSAFSGSAFSGSAFSGSAFSGSAFSGSAFSGSAFSGSAFSGSAFSGSAFSTAYTSAEVDSVIAVSTQEGAVDKSVTADTYNDTGDFFVQVAGDNDASSSTPFLLTVTTSGSPCVSSGGTLVSVPSTTLDPVGITATAGGYNTLIVEDSAPMNTQYGATAVASMNTELADLAGAPGVNGDVIDLANSPQVQALAAQAASYSTCPYAANLEAQSIQSIINSFRIPGNNIQNVVIVGDDDVVPFFRYPDQAGLAPESDYQPPLASTSEANAALQDNYYLTDDPYGTTAADELNIQGTTLSLETAAVGRLVETPAEIDNTIQDYLSENGVIAPKNALATGYSFMAPAAQSVASSFATGLGSSSDVTSLIDTGNGSSTDPTVWSAGTLMDNLDDLNPSSSSTSSSLVFLGAHFSANNLLASDDTSTLTTNTFSQEIGDNLENSLVISPGCHSGYNIDPLDAIPNVTDTLAWPEAFTDAGATLVAGTGYQYGDTNYTAYSDQVYVDLAQQLDETEDGGAPTIGNALVDAKQQYLSTLFQLDGIEVKALEQITLYGLPMLGVSMTGQQGTDSSTASVMGSGSAAVNPVGSGVGASMGLESGTLDYTLPPSGSPDALTAQQPVTNPSGGPNYTYSGFGPTPQFTAVTGGPVLPVQTENVSVGNAVLRGVGFMSGTYSDTTGTNPLTGDPATDTSNAIIPFSSSTFYPQTTWNPNYYNAITGANGGDTELAITPQQYVSDANGDGYATQRQYSQMSFQLFYDSTADADTSTSALLAAPPEISGVSSTYTPSGNGYEVNVTANVSGDATAGVQQVWATYTGNDASDGLYGQWQSVELTQPTPESTVWTGSYFDPGSTISHAPDSEFMVQAANGVGAVTLDTNEGNYFTAGTDPGAPLPAGTTVNTYTVQLGGSQSGPYGTTAKVTATLAPGANDVDPVVGGQPITFTLGASSLVGYTASGSSGVATVNIPLDQAPGDYPLNATYFDQATGTTVSAPTGVEFDITAAQPTLSQLTVPASGQVTSGQALNGAGQQNNVTVTLSAPSGPSTAPVAAPVANQTVYFDIDSGNTVLETIPAITNSSGVAQTGPVTLPPGDVGNDTVTAYYNQASIPAPSSSHGSIAATVDPDYSAAAPATGASLDVVDGTTTSLQIQPDPATYGQSLTLTATVASAALGGPAAPVNLGTVTFEQVVNGNASPVSSTCTGETLSNGTATCTVSNPASGSYTYEANYLGSAANYLTSTSSQQGVPVGMAQTSTALTVSSGGSTPSSSGTSAFGASVTLNATVTVTNGAGAPTGTVTFYDGSGELGTGTLSGGSVSITVKGLQEFSSSPIALSAVYAGNNNFVGSTGKATDTVTFTKTISGTQSGALTISSGQTVLITGTVTGAVSLSGGALEVLGGSINGALSSSTAVQFTMCGAKVGGAMSISSSRGFVFIGGPTGTGTNCAASSIGGAVSLTSNTGGLEMISSSAGGAMSVTSNSGYGPIEVNGSPVGPEISGNTIGGALSCSSNSPSLADGGSINKVGGARSGQCAGSF